MRCDFKNKNDLVRAYAIYKANNADPEAFKQSLQKAFNNWDVAEQAVLELVGGSKPPTNSNSFSIKKTTTSTSNNEGDLFSYYLNSTRLNQMELNFKRRILGASVLRINSDGSFEYVNPKNVQNNIILYKQELINTIDNGSICLTNNIPDDDYTSIVQNTISKYESILATSAETPDPVKYDAYVILKNFDRLLRNNAPYIQIGKVYEENNTESVNKYNIVAQVAHFSGFSGKDESADIMKQISNLASVILQVIPDIDKNDQIVGNNTVGVAGFNSAMQTLKKALLYSDQFDEDDRQAYSAGALQLLSSDSSNINSLIDRFIKKNESSSKETVSDFNEKRQVYLHNKLRGISKYLFNDSTPAYIKNMFIQLFYKTDTTGYRAYSIDWESEVANFKGRELKSRSILYQKFAFQDIIRGGLQAIQTSTSLREGITALYDITYKQVGTDEEIIISDSFTHRTLEIVYTPDYDRFAIKSVSGDEALVNDLMKQLFSYVIPDTYRTCLGETNYKIQDDFAPFIVLAAKEVLCKSGRDSGQHILSINGDGTVSLKKFNVDLLKVGTRLGIVFGDSIKSTIRSLEGTSLPSFQLTSLEYNAPMCISDIRTSPWTGSRFNPQISNLLVTNFILQPPVIRNSVLIGNAFKECTKLSAIELNKLAILDDFFFPIISGDDVLYLQNMTFSDKFRQFLPGYTLNTKLDLISYGINESYTLKDLIKDSLNGGRKLSHLTWKLRNSSYSGTAWNIVQDYAIVFPDLKLDTEVEDAASLLSELIKIDNHIKNIPISELRKKFRDAHINFIENTHAYVPRNGNGKSRINETLLSYLDSVTDERKWQEATKKQLQIFRDDIKDICLSSNDHALQSTNAQSYFQTLINWRPTNIAEKDAENWKSHWYNKNTQEFRLISNNGEIHPIALSYFLTNRLLSNEYNSVVYGEVWAQDNKNKEGKTEEEYRQFSEGSRFVNAIKRAVIYGSTIHPFAQGIKNENGYNIGVTPTVKTAIMTDAEGKVYTALGKADTLDPQDGCGFATGLQSRLENNSLVDAFAGENKKTILHNSNPAYGTPSLLKWAVYELSNSVRRMGAGSNINVENIVRKAYGLNIYKNINAQALNNILNEYTSTHGDVYVKDTFSLGYRRLIRFEETNEGIVSVYEITDNVITRNPARLVRTLYDVDQLFGGAWTYNKIDDKFLGSEASADLLTEVAIRYDLRDAQIGYIVNASAVKVGQTNLNGRERWTDDKPLDYFKFSTKYGGVMMDADHKINEAEVTEMTQMISALIEGGCYTDLATTVYADIANLAITNPSIDKLVKIMQTNNKKDAKQLLSKVLIDSFSSGSKDVIGLAQAFIRKANAAYQKEVKGKGKAFNMPFSDSTIFGAVVSAITSWCNKNGIRRKYEGLAVVQNPSHDMVQYYEYGTQTMLFDEFNEMCRNELWEIASFIDDLGFSYEDYEGNLKYTKSWQELAQKAYKIGTTLNPFLKQVSPNDIDFEDTIVVINPTKHTYETIYIDDFKKYDELRNLRDLTGCAIYKSTACPRNLRGMDTYMDIVSVDITGTTHKEGRFSYYNLDSVRAGFYRQELLNNPNTDFAEEKRALLKGFEGISDKDLRNITQDILARMDLSKTNLNHREEIPYQNCFKCLPAIRGNKKYYITNYETRPGEIIMSRYQLSKLGIKPTDKISDITSEEFFISKLRAQYSPDVNWGISRNALKKLYDQILFHNGQPFFVKIDDTGKFNVHGEDGITEEAQQSVQFIGNDLCWDSTVISSYINPEDIWFSVISSSTSGQQNLITVKNEETLKKLKCSAFFDDFWRLNVTNTKWYTESFERHIERVARDRWEAFQQAQYYVGARIPTQNMASFMPYKVVAFIDSDKNIAYFSKKATYTQGSDYDIDKVYLMAASISDNGKIMSGSALQPKIGFNATVQLFQPENIIFEEGEGTGIPEEALIKCYNDYQEGNYESFIFWTNYINNQVPEDTVKYIKFKSTSGNNITVYKNWFLSAINEHSSTPFYMKKDIAVLKNRVFASTKKITLGAQNQLRNQIGVDEVTKPLKRKAENSIGGASEKTASSNIASSIMQMQEQNMLGKEVVGIGAVSLKTYFLTVTAFDKMALRLANAINQGDVKTVNTLLDKLTIVDPNGDITTISGTNFTKAIEAINNMDPTNALYKRHEDLLEALQQLDRASKKTVAAEFNSAIISLAADNAKDQALPKLNATADLVDIYTAANALGLSFEYISKIMMSPLFMEIAKLGKANIFEEATLNNRVKSLIKELVEPKFSKTNTNALIDLYKRYNKSDIKWPEFGKMTPKDWEVLEKAIEEEGLLLNVQERPWRMSADDWEQFEFADQFLDDDGYDFSYKDPTEGWNRFEYYQAYRQAKTYWGLKGMATNEDLENLGTLAHLIEAAEEMSTLGRQAGINQGMKTNVADFYNFSKNVENFVNKKIAKHNKETEKSKAPQITEQFDMNQFLQNDEYADYWAQDPHDLFKYFNVLGILRESPLFYNMSRIMSYVGSILYNNTSSFANVVDIADALTAEGIRLTDKDFAEIQRYVTDTYIFKFLKSADIVLDINELATKCGHSITEYTNMSKFHKITADKLAINDILQIASFKHIMEADIIPTLKQDPAYKNNSFIQDLGLREDRRTKHLHYALPIQMMSIDKEVSTQNQYVKYLNDFNTLCKSSFAGNNLGDLFFLYNLISNKNGYGDQSLTRIFEDLINSENVPKVIESYYNYLSMLDDKVVITTDVEEARYRIRKYVKNTRVKNGDYNNVPLKMDLTDDFTFDLPKTSGYSNSIIYEDLNNETISLAKLSVNEVLDALVASLDKQKIQVHRITNSEAEARNLPKDRGFIHNGEVYLNIDKFSDSGNALTVGIHEISHLIIAALKARPQDSDSRNQLYEMLKAIHNDPEYESIAKCYSDRIGSDLDEEVLCNKIEKILSNNINNTSQVDIALYNGRIIFNKLKEIFPNLGDKTPISELINTNLEQAIEKYAYSLFQVGNSISTDYILSSQRLAALKKRLYDSQKEDYNLKKKC